MPVHTFDESTLTDLRPEAVFGLYIVRSFGSNPNAFRAGAAGFKGTIHKRLRQHAGTAPTRRKRPPNWTELNRPFRPLWVADLEDATFMAALCSERLLLAELGKHFQFVSESGFTALPSEQTHIFSIAENLKPEVEDIIRLQRASMFQKEQWSGTDWIAPLQAG